MADTLPINFPLPSEQAIATYDYTDIAEGTGIVQFYGARASIDNTPANDATFLIRNSGLIPSVSEFAIATGNDKDYDVTFNLPKIIDGTLYAVIPVRHTNSSGSSNVSITVTIIHYDGSTETTIGTAITAPTDTKSSAASYYYDECFKFSISKKVFKKGDILRVTVGVTITGDGTVAVGNDPTASDSNWTVSGGRMSIFVPFDLDL